VIDHHLGYYIPSGGYARLVELRRGWSNPNGLPHSTPYQCMGSLQLRPSNLWKTILYTSALAISEKLSPPWQSLKTLHPRQVWQISGRRGPPRGTSTCIIFVCFILIQIDSISWRDSIQGIWIQTTPPKFKAKDSKLICSEYCGYCIIGSNIMLTNAWISCTQDNSYMQLNLILKLKGGQVVFV
jgi:hypothetical protein